MRTPAFAIWLTGLPASGKSTITRTLVAKLHGCNVFPVVLESDHMRRILTPEPTYHDDERQRFYAQLVAIGDTIYRSDVPVIFDATGNRRIYRERARKQLDRFVEIYVNSPLDICKSRDPKGIYAAALSGAASTVPGVQTAYEPPESPELAIDGRTSPDVNAELILECLRTFHYL